jgi:hypothetical protein
MRKCGGRKTLSAFCLLEARVSALAILYTVVRETYLVGKEIFPGSEDAK